MPQIRMLGIPDAVVADIAAPVARETAASTGCPPEEVVVSKLSATTYRDGEVADHPPFVEVWWFERSQEMQDAVARMITRLLREHGITAVDVVFNLYARSRYYENGEHF